MTPHQLITWVRCASPGESVIYYAGRHEVPPAIFTVARQLHAEGKVMLYQTHNQWVVRKINTRTKRFLDRVSASVAAPRMGPFGLYAAGLGPDPGAYFEPKKVI